MYCPLCELPVVMEEDPDEVMRAICCNCRISITVRDLPDDYVCEEEN